MLTLKGLLTPDMSGASLVYCILRKSWTGSLTPITSEEMSMSGSSLMYSRIDNIQKKFDFEVSHGLDWIGLTVGYWCFHRSRECSQAHTYPYKASAHWSRWLFLRTSPLEGFFLVSSFLYWVMDKWYWVRLYHSQFT